MVENAHFSIDLLFGETGICLMIYLTIYFNCNYVNKCLYSTIDTCANIWEQKNYKRFSNALFLQQVQVQNKYV